MEAPIFRLKSQGIPVLLIVNAIDEPSGASYGMPISPAKVVSSLQLMILLSALLASLTGFVAGERPVASAQVELSAAAVAVEAGEAAVLQSERPRQSVVAVPAVAQIFAAPLAFVAPVVTRRAHLDIKQSWLI